MNKKGLKGIAPILFLNPDPVVHLEGHANEVPVVIDGCKVTALIDSAAQVLNISMQLCKDLDLKIQPLGQLLELEGKGGAAIPYLRFVEVNLQIMGLEVTMRMCCCWLSPPRPMLKEFQSWWVQK